MKKITLTLVLLAFLLAACSGTVTSTPTAQPAAETTPDTVTAEGKLIPAPSAELAFAQSGVIAAVRVKPGAKLAAHEVIARLVGLENVQAERATALLEQLTAQQALEALKRNALLNSTQAEKALLDAQKAYESASNGWNVGVRNDASDLELALDDYVSAEHDYRDARDKLTALLNKEKTNRERINAQEDFDREKKSQAEAYADLLKSVAENDRPLIEKQTLLLTAISNLEMARELQSRLDDQNLDPEKWAAAKAMLEAATAHLAAAEAALELYELRAPFGGTLLSLDLATGESTLPGSPVAFLADTSRWTVETKDLAEIDIARVALAQGVLVKLDAFPDEQFSGKVSAIDPVGKEHLGDMTYKVTITLNDADPRFMWNMTAIVKIDVKR